jgi:paraquat-inducible protein A
MNRATNSAGLNIAASDGQGKTGAEWVACPDCGLGQHVPPLAIGHLASCSRCHCTLAANPGYSLNTVLAVAVAGLILLPFAILSPLFSLFAYGGMRQSWIYGGAQELWREGFFFLAAIVDGFSSAAPLAYLVLLVAVLSVIGLRAKSAWLGPAFRWSQWLRSWAMPEIFVVGGFVAYSRMEKIASVKIGYGSWAFLAASLAFLAIDFLLDRRAVWREIGPDSDSNPSPNAIACRACALLVPRASDGEHCPRCGASLHHRKPQALARTSALVIAAYLLYIPANLLPVLTIENHGTVKSDTIMAGVKALADIGAWPLAVIVFVASIMVPLIKLLSLTWFLTAEMSAAHQLPVVRTRLHEIVNNIGRWSNIDVFMGSILVALVQFGVLYNVTAGRGATYFATVVLITMIASRCFDPRLMWDSKESKP